MYACKNNYMKYLKKILNNCCHNHFIYTIRA